MSKNARIGLVIAVVLVLAALVFARDQQVRAEQAKSDGYYCTLAGVGPLDRGPNTGRLCADLLDD